MTTSDPKRKPGIARPTIVAQPELTTYYARRLLEKGRLMAAINSTAFVACIAVLASAPALAEPPSDSFRVKNQKSRSADQKIQGQLARPDNRIKEQMDAVAKLQRKEDAATDKMKQKQEQGRVNRNVEKAAQATNELRSSTNIPR